MNRDNGDFLRESFNEIPEIPFSDELRLRILEAAKANPVVSRNRRGSWKPWLAAVSGVVAAVFVLAAVMAHPGKVVPDNSRQLASASVTLGYRLQPSALKVTDLFIGTTPGSPQNSSVIAEVTNTGNEPIGKTDVVGVLAFPMNTAKNSLLQSDSLFLVNGPSQPVAPGQSAQWTFHPVGAPHNTSSQLTEQPYLVFFTNQVGRVQAGTASAGAGQAAGNAVPPVDAATSSQGAFSADKRTGTASSSTTNAANPATPSTQSDVGSPVASTVWLKSPKLTILHQEVTFKSSGPTWNAVRVTLTLKNSGTTTISLNSLWALTWYGTQTGQDLQPWNWGEPQDTRFINHLQASSASIAPGEQLEVYFDLVGSSQFDFLDRTPHVAIIQR